jgi:glycine betaine/proline transport system substrate-binding protein
MLRSGCLLVLGGALCVTLTACGSQDTNPPVERTTVRIAHNAWLGSDIDNAVAKNLLETQLSLKVELVDIDEFAQWEQIASGKLDASLEVWPSGHHDDIKKYIDGGLVENAGPLGPIGKIGWYVPTYVVDAHPTLATSDGLTDPANIALFNDAQSAPKGGTFYGVDPAYTQFDQAIIDSLKLDLKVVFVGTEDAILAQLATAYAAKQPMLFYFWTPHPGIAAYDLTKIALPAYSDACYAKGAALIACDYPVDNLLKILSLDLAKEVPKAHKLLSSFNYSTGDQVSLMTLVDSGMTVDDAAASWVTEHQSTWKSWVQ